MGQKGMGMLGLRESTFCQNASYPVPDSGPSQGPGRRIRGFGEGGGGILTQDGQHHVVTEHLQRADEDE